MANIFAYTEYTQTVLGMTLRRDDPLDLKRLLRLAFFHFYPVFIFIPTEIVMTARNASNLVNFAGAFTNTASHLGIALKAIVYYAYRSEILHVVEVLKDQGHFHQAYEGFRPLEIVGEYKRSVERWAKTFLVTGTFICVCMSAFAVLAVLDYKPPGGEDVVLFPNFGETREGLALYWLFTMPCLAVLLGPSVGEYLSPLLVKRINGFVQTLLFLFLSFEEDCSYSRFCLANPCFSVLSKRSIKVEQ